AGSAAVAAESATWRHDHGRRLYRGWLVGRWRQACCGRVCERGSGRADGAGEPAVCTAGEGMSDASSADLQSVEIEYVEGGRRLFVFFGGLAAGVSIPPFEFYRA